MTMRFFAPKSEKDWQEAFIHAREEGLKIRFTSLKAVEHLSPKEQTHLEFSNEFYLSTAHLFGILDYNKEERTLSVKAGTPLKIIENHLFEHDQILPFEPLNFTGVYNPASYQNTIGGIVASNAAGSRRILAGGIRENTLGLSLINGLGEHLHFGGRVVKNVTGYDITKLNVGAWGALGVITTLTLKLAPRPEAQTTLSLQGMSRDNAIALCAAALSSPAEVSGAVFFPKDVHGQNQILLRLEGSEKSVRQRQAYLLDFLPKLYLRAALHEDIESHGLWKAIRDCEPVLYPKENSLWRFHLPPSFTPKLLTLLSDELEESRYFVDWGGARVWLNTPETEEFLWKKLQPLIMDARGSAICLRHPQGFIRRPSHGNAFETETQRAIKSAFDPHDIFLNPMHEGAY